MSAYSMKPTFTDAEGYREWRRQWRVVYKRLSATIRDQKHRTKALQRENAVAAPKAQKDLAIDRAMARKLNMLLNEAKARMKRIADMQVQIANQGFPLKVEDCRVIDFHFNRGHNEFPFLPMWTVKAKGRSFYVHHVEAKAPWSTKERPEGSTKGLIRFKAHVLQIDAEGNATIG